ncbi:relaxase/mobilization nuclease domain-containing protein [Streptomyces triticiradicis]|uniref:Relaxase/mobilization nuclease domain-containing protein n=1 Tax=Streptomyces triticiradicis TaxID=2651189 RepID=A0A7J5D2U4_9ACTN|nr:relaxase/mobilization nuclease domain-containing protein [Streptomyces triticiradicis]KAB1977949.1 relaxase/mobilization nuclease domain-containing protein [Streptomyces triticiradicis]
MIPRVHKQGSNTLGLLHYLYGKGTREEHIDPHLVASFDGMAPDPGRDPSVTKTDLRHLLDQTLSLLDADQRPDKHVWHCSVRAAPDDPILSDEQWGDIARRMVAATGINPGDGAGCRWAAVRHADDHIHIVATLVREDGRRPDHHRSGKRAQTEARLIEADYDLHRVAPGDGTAAKRTTSAERHKADRLGWDRAAREELRETVRRAVAGATSTDEFLDRLKDSGLLVRTKALPSGDLKGYTVALPGDRNGNKEPIYYAGSTLAPDLSLPRIQARFITDSVPPGTADSERQERSTASSAPAAARCTTAHAAWAAVLVLDHSSDDSEAAAQIAAAGEVLDALAKTSALHARNKLRQAAWEFERASRSHTRAEFRHAQDLRRAARDLVCSGPAFGRGEDGAGTAMVLDTLIFLALAAAHWHAQRQHAQQAEAARRAAAHLRSAYQQAAAEPLTLLRERGRRIAPSLRRHHATTVRAALPELAETVLAEPGWDALAATLADAERAGHNPHALLAEAAAGRELDTVDSVSDVLVWRLRRTAHLPLYAPAQEAIRANRPNDHMSAGQTMPVSPASRARRR